ncbi:unnamed protein product [Coregonus sp. 'balchen']|nr:unnamed protein product [Coregonus sp. 'balchen']
MTDAVFQAPKRRARVYEAYDAPFPVPLAAEEARLQQTLIYRAEMVNQHVIVRDPEHIQALYGKASYQEADQTTVSHTNGKGLEEDVVNQMLQRLCQPMEPELREENGHDDRREETGSGAGKLQDMASEQAGTGEQQVQALASCSPDDQGEQDSECPQAKRPRRQGDSRFDPLAELYPQEPQQIDQAALDTVRCSKHDDWLVDCGCRLEDSVLETLTLQGDRQAEADRGYEYVLVMEEEEEEEENSVVKAFFLVYALGCLSVYYNEEPLSVLQLWEMFRSVQPHFETSYMAYHYFRSRGWVPKPGVKYGTDLMLYRKGPPFYHSSYSVVVEKVHQPCRGGALRPFSWRSLAALSRITGNVSKDLMLCYIIYPSHLTEEHLSSPDCLCRVTVQEIILSRWISSRERTETDDI